MEHQGLHHEVTIEVVLGCRRSSGVRAGGSAGIDLYGNDRLIVPFDKQIFADMLPAGNVRNYIRGFVNFHGPNVFIPWDTHKRHINLDRELIGVITKHPLVRQLFENWRRTYLSVSRSADVINLLDTTLPQIIDRQAHDLFLPHRAVVQLDLGRRRGVEMPADVFVPHVAGQARSRGDVKLGFRLTLDEGRNLAAFYGVRGDPSASRTAEELSEAVKADVLSRATRRRRE